MLKRLVALLALIVSAVLLSGCVSIKSVVSSQQDVVGPLRVTLVVCASDRAPTINHPGCNYQSNLGEGVPGSGQLLVALRVPEGTMAPPSVVGTTNDASTSTLALQRDPSYEAELSRLLPAGGRVWVGYRSAVYDYDAGPAGTLAREVSIPIDLTLPRSSDGAPYIGPLPVVPVAGGRVVSASAPEARPANCGTSAFAASSDATICVDSPIAALAAADYNFQTRDFGVLAGKATASPGQTVTLPFNVRGAGALPAGLTAALTASTALPGAGAVTPSVASAALSNGSDTRVTVPVAIPKNAGPGVFDVTVTARLDNGQTRTGVAKLTVRDRQKPVLSNLKAKPKRFKAATKKKPKRGTNVAFTLSEPASVRLTVERCAKRKRGRCVRWKALKGGLTQAGAQGANKVRFNGRLRGKALKAGGYRIVLTSRDGAANVGKAARVAFAVRQ